MKRIFTIFLVLGCFLAAGIWNLSNLRPNVTEPAQAQPGRSADDKSAARMIEQLRAVATLAQPAKPFDPKCEASDLACQSWARFRNAHPFPYQTLAAGALPDGSIALVVSEPPESIAKAEVTKLLRDVFGSDLLEIATRRWMIGIDGWVEDIVMRVRLEGATPASKVNDLIDDEVFSDRIAFLQLAFYGTTFGAGIEALERPDSEVQARLAPNLAVPHRELEKWILDPQTRWREIEQPDATAVHWNAISKTGPVALVSQDSSLVILAFPATLLARAHHDAAALGSFRIPFRRFAVASDTVLGGVWGRDGSVAIIGRGRVQPPEVIPPLRFETFVVLARAATDELAQSYERTNVMAGKLSKGPYAYRDWAPIYLSASLIDTEFGALLNITDQILKSWSEAGETEYIYFSYPKKPEQFPFNEALSATLRQRHNADRVLFNWNTSGSAAVFRSASMSVFATGKTGALPVTYGSELSGDRDMKTGHLPEFETKAYDYFADLRDPNLARVVQYTLIYQMFRALAQDSDLKGTFAGLKDAETNEIPVRKQARAVVVKRVADLLSGVKTGSIKPPDVKEFRDAAAATGFATEFAELKSLLNRSEFANVASVAELVAYPEDESRAIAGAARAAGDLIKQQEIDFKSHERDVDAHNQRINDIRRRVESRLITSRPEMEGLERELTTTRAQLEAREAELVQKYAPLKGLSERQERLEQVVKIRSIVSRIAALSVDRDEVRAAFIAANAAVPTGWIKTPSVVLSWASSNISQVGGHNLTARALRFEPTADVAGIQVVQSTQGSVVRYNPKLQAEVSANASQIARAVEHRAERDVQKLVDLAQRPAPLRTRSAALGLDEAPQVAEVSKRPLDQRVTEWEGYLGTRIFRSRKDFENVLTKYANDNACCVFVARDNKNVAYMVEKNASPPPTAKLARLGDSVSLRQQLAERLPESVRGPARLAAQKPIIFLDYAPEQVEALTTGLGRGRAADGGALKSVAAFIGGGGGRNGGGGMHVQASGFDGRRHFLSIAMRDAQAERSGLVARLQGFVESKLVWSRAEPKILEGSEAKALLGDIAWNEATDGRPVAVVLSIPKQAAGERVEVGVVAGLRESRQQEGVNQLQGAQQSAREQALRESDANVLSVLLAIKEKLRNLDDKAFGRWLMILRDRKDLINFTRSNTATDADRG